MLTFVHMFTQKVAISLPPICFPVISVCCFGCITRVAACSGASPELPVGFVVEAAPGPALNSKHALRGHERGLEGLSVMIPFLLIVYY